MRLQAHIQFRLDPPGTALAVKHRRLANRLRGLFISDPRNDSLIRLNPTRNEVLRKWESLLRDLACDDVIRVSQAGKDLYFDTRKRPDDLARALEKTFAAPEPEYDPAAGATEALELVLESNTAEFNLILKLEIRHLYRLDEYPFCLSLDALAAQGTTGEVAAAAFRRFLHDLDRKTRGVFSVGEMDIGKVQAGNAPAGKAAEKTADPSRRVAVADAPEDGPAVLFPLYGVTLGRTTVDELAGMGSRATDRDEEGTPYKYYVVNDMNFWFDDGRAKSIYITYSDALPAQWRALGFDWQLSYDEWTSVLENMGCFLSITKPPRTIRHFSGEHDSFEAGLSGLQNTETGTLSIDLNFNYSNGTRTADQGTLYSIGIRVR